MQGITRNTTPRRKRSLSVCPHDCQSQCPVEVDIDEHGSVTRLYGNANSAYHRGVVCAKVARYDERVHHPDRLTQPLRRVGERGRRDSFRPMAWDDALDMVAERFSQASARLGAETVWPFQYAGTMGQVQRDGINRLRHCMGYSGFHGTVCSTPANAGWYAGVGAKRGIDSREIASSDLIVLWGCNAVYTQVHVMSQVALARKQRGAKLVVIDPYQNETARLADIHLAPSPGSDGALACAIMQVLLHEGYADHDFLTHYTDFSPDLRAHLDVRGPAWAASITGLDAEEIVAFARLYGQTQRSFLKLGYGFTRHRNGAVQMHAASCLPAITGAWRHPGGGALYSAALCPADSGARQGESGPPPGGLYPLDKTLIEGLDRCDPSTRVLDQSRIGSVLLGDATALRHGPPVTALLVQSTNPAATHPDSSLVRRGMARDDLFTCVHEQFMTDTALMADIVLPATTFLEHDDLYTGGGHTLLMVARAAIAAVGEARSNHEVICALARRLGAEHPGFDVDAWSLIDQTLRISGLPGADEIWQRAQDSGENWVDCAQPFETAHFLDGFGHPDRRFRFSPQWQELGEYSEGMPCFPDHYAVIEATGPDKPFRLVTAPARHFLNSSFTETPTSQRIESEPRALMHPIDMASLGLGEDDWIRVGNDRGEVVLRISEAEKIARHTVIIESIWPKSGFANGVGINVLIGSDPIPPNGGAAFHDCAVWVRAEVEQRLRDGKDKNQQSSLCAEQLAEG